MVDVYLTYGVALLLAILPTAMVLTSKDYVINRRKQMLAQDFRASNSNSSKAFDDFLSSRGGIEGLQTQIEEYMSQGFWFPLLVLTALNAAGLTLCTEYLRNGVDISYGPVVYTFLGTYLFNLGVMTRRLSFSDFNAQMVWGSVNRLLLAAGLFRPTGARLAVICS